MSFTETLNVSEIGNLEEIPVICLAIIAVKTQTSNSELYVFWKGMNTILFLSYLINSLYFLERFPFTENGVGSTEGSHMLTSPQIFHYY